MLNYIKVVYLTMCPRETSFDSRNAESRETVCVHDFETCASTGHLIFGVIVALLTLGQSEAQDKFPVPDRLLPETIYCEFDRDDGLGPMQFGTDSFFIEGIDAAWHPQAFKPDRVPPVNRPEVFRGTVQVRVNRQYFGPTASLYDVSSRLRGAKSRWEGQRLLEMTDLRSGPVTKGDLIPVFGWLFQVTRCQRGGGDTADLRLQKVARDAWPAGVTLDPYAYAVTTGGALRIPGNSFSTKGQPGVPITVTFNPVEKAFSIQVTHESVAAEDLSLRQEIRQITATPGLRFPVMRGSDSLFFQVISVVSPDPEHGIPGWVEFRRMWPEITPFGFNQSEPAGQ